MQTRLRHAAAAGWFLLLVILAGCDMAGQPERAATARAGRASDFASRPFEGVELAQIQPLAERVFRSYFRLDPAASAATHFVAFPSGIDARGPAVPGEGPAVPAEEAGAEDRPRETVGDIIGVAPRRYRRVAEMRLLPGEDRVLVQVRVAVQRLSTTERAAFARERGDDRPTDTAIDRLGPASPAAREEWREYRRDRGMEREVLDAIQAGLSPVPPAGG